MSSLQYFYFFYYTLGVFAYSLHEQPLQYILDPLSSSRGDYSSALFETYVCPSRLKRPFVRHASNPRLSVTPETFVYSSRLKRPFVRHAYSSTTLLFPTFTGGVSKASFHTVVVSTRNTT